MKNLAILIPVLLLASCGPTVYSERPVIVEEPRPIYYDPYPPLDPLVVVEGIEEIVRGPVIIDRPREGIRRERIEREHGRRF